MTRIASIDTFRGLMLVFMMFFHLILFPFVSILHFSQYTYGVFGFFTDAEGFYFLSGLVAGIVYGKLYLEDRDDEAAARIFKRVKEIYFWYVGLFFIISCSLILFERSYSGWNTLHQFIPSWIGKEGIHFFLDHPFQSFLMGCFFLYLPPYLDILPLYVIFLGIAPAILSQLKQGRVRRVLLVSVTIWAMTQFVPDRLLESLLRQYFPAKLAWFDPLAWQLLFVGGLSLGFLQTQGLLQLPRFATWICPVLVIFFFWLRHQEIDFGKASALYSLGPLRVLNFAAVACSIWAFNQYLAFRPLAFLGKYSLQVFVYHIALVYFLVCFFDEINALSLAPKLALLACCMLSLWIPAYVTHRRKGKKLATSPIS